MDEAATSRECQNCGAPLDGAYCSVCGQKDEHRILPIKHLLHEVFHEIVHLDARFLKSVWMLLRPGALTAEYIAGRRVRWFPPFRLYLVVSLAFFAAASLGPTNRDIRLAFRPGAQAVQADGRVVLEPSSASATRLQRKAEAINRDPTAFVHRLLAWLPRVFFLLLPLFALLLQAAYFRTRTLFAVHAVFSLHEHAFAFLVFTAFKLLGFVPYVRTLRGFLLLALPLHLLFGLKRIHGQGWALTLLKSALVGTAHLLAVLAAVVLTTLALLLYT